MKKGILCRNAIKICVCVPFYYPTSCFANLKFDTNNITFESTFDSYHTLNSK